MSDTDERENGDMPESAAAPAGKQGSSEVFRETETVLPEWLDDCLSEMGAVYRPKDTRYQYTLDLSEPKVKVYLGTYFPRSYSEAFCIAGNLFTNSCYMASLKDALASFGEINILDVGCGSGGEIIGLLDVIRRFLPSSVRVNVCAFDGNQLSLDSMKKIADCFIKRSGAEIKVDGKLRRIDSESDLAAIADEVRNVRFDFILCCKVGGELISGKVTDRPYSLVAEKFSGLLKPAGLLLLLDVTIKLESRGWLPVAMNHELNAFICSQNEFGTLIPKPCGKYPECSCNCYTRQTFTVRHSGAKYDESRVCYRIICRNSLREKMVPDSVMDVTQVVDHEKYYGPWRDAYPWSDGSCRYTGGKGEADGFDINLTPEETRGLTEERKDTPGTGDTQSNG